MKAKKLVLTAACLFVVLCGSLSENIQEVQAEVTQPTALPQETVIPTPVVEEPVQQPSRVVDVEVNSPDAFDQIKASLIQSTVFEEAGVDPTLIDITKCEMNIGPIDTTKAGTQDINVMINVKPINEATILVKSTISTKVLLRVIDNTAPVLKLTKDSIRVQLGSEFNPWDYVEYVYDNSNEDIYQTLQITNPVDSNVEAEYEIIYTATDSSGNTTELKVPVKVQKQIVVQGGVASGDEIEYMLQLINDVREQNGLNPYTLADEAGQTAIAIRAAESVNNITHRRPDGSHYKTALSDQGVVWDHSPLEILTSSGSTVEAKLNWWLNSAGHRSILLKSDYETIAIGYSGNMWAAIAY
ncbi:immunoglobulin-like domain-containing protein [Anaerorhabdus sp.]|uniref:immunoglobulin-like domain-containing protein n=1 Tax=Anaerorhabdus sp. TaxID=1872524 RepID=UPI002FC82F3F